MMISVATQIKRRSTLVNWLDLPQDLRISIAKRLVCMEDFLSFGAVCKSWRSIATKENFTAGLTQQVPFCILPQKEGTANRKLYNLTKGKSFELNSVPNSKGERLYSSLGWLMTESEDSKVFMLVHPLNHTQIKLPENYRPHQIRSFALSTSPSLTSDFVVMVIDRASRGLAFCRAKDNEWTRVDTTGNDLYCDLSYHKDQFYVVDCDGRILVCEIQDPKNAKTREVVPEIPWDITDFGPRLHLVESAGTLLVVHRSQFRETFSFKVFEVPFSNCDWSHSEVKKLGNRTLFLNELGSSFSIEAPIFSRIETNCIYFSSVQFCLDVGTGMCLFTEDEKSDMRLVIDIDSYRFAISSLWIQPSF